MLDILKTQTEKIRGAENLNAINPYLKKLNKLLFIDDFEIFSIQNRKPIFVIKLETENKVSANNGLFVK